MPVPVARASGAFEMPQTGTLVRVLNVILLVKVIFFVFRAVRCLRASKVAGEAVQSAKMRERADNLTFHF